MSDKKRKYLSGHEKRQKKRLEEEKKQEDKRALLKYMLPVSKAPAVAGSSTPTSSSTVTQAAGNAGLSPVEVVSSTPMPSTTSPGSLSTPLDPADWPTVINDKVRIDLMSATRSRCLL
ncbi:uncharacterized protein LOC120492995 isoform X3 [Pimephales promelas]|uniref:uncharacterized protein LOC120492995 isoform X3 n=1 Tax=Pimephales promelas TaxID=90988 RepID=UPI001955CBCF|nr:uncharacterized protein LOC120492995 isoform X3 [Pimephales promelas]